ncbi:MAG: ribonuclease HII [Bacillota bacterium]
MIAIAVPGASGSPNLSYEQRLWAQGFLVVAGIDEVGRGSLLASVVAGAVVLPPGTFIGGVRDSKALSPSQRETLCDIIEKAALGCGIGAVDAETIDRVNIKQAARLAMKLAVEDLGFRPDHLLVDAETVPCFIPQTRIVHGDALCYSIAAASIVAKVARDRMCEVWHEQYPEYNIRAHKGYCTREHVQAILRYGPCPLHRKTFLKRILAHHSSERLNLGL